MGWTRARCGRASRRHWPPRRGTMGDELRARIEEAAAFVRARTPVRPEVGIILGTGLGDFADAIKGQTVVPYRDIPRFPDMSEPYSRRLVALAEHAALRLGIPLQRAVFVAVAGPNLETAAEYRFLRWIGADVVGMSLVPEVIVAVHGGQRVLALNVV